MVDAHKEDCFLRSSEHSLHITYCVLSTYGICASVIVSQDSRAVNKRERAVNKIAVNICVEICFQMMLAWNLLTEI